MPRLLGRRRGTMIFVFVVTLLTSLFAPAGRAASSEAQRLLTLVNGSRARAGLQPLHFDRILMSTAQSHAEKMAASGRLYHNPSYPSGTGASSAWGENVGTGSNVDTIHREFMSSSSHRQNVLKSSFNAVGIGIARYSGGIMVVEDYLARPGQIAAATTPSGRSAAPRRQKESPPPPPPEPPKPPHEIAKWIPVGSVGQMASLEQLDAELVDLADLHQQLAPSSEAAILKCRFDAIAPGPSLGTIQVLTVCEVDAARTITRRHLL